MDVSLLPSQFLSVVLEENDKNGGSRSAKSISESLSTSALTISPVVPNPPSIAKKKVNGKLSASLMKNGISKFTNGVTHRNEYLDLKKRLPRTVLEECIVELADSSSKIYNKVPERPKNAVIIRPMYARKNEKPMPPQKPKMEKIDFRDLFARVEAVYSDDDEPQMSAIPYAALSAPKLNGFPPPGDVGRGGAPHTNGLASDAATSLGFACDHCPNKYSNKGALWQHNVAAHSIEKSCECQLCGRKFYRNCSLALHMKCHSDEQNCSCKVCGKEFNRLSMLERHLKCHNAEAAAVANGATSAPPANVVTTATASVSIAAPAPSTASMGASAVTTTATATTTPCNSQAPTYVCKICHKKCPDEAAYRTHVFAHNEKFSCEQCNVAFNTRQLLELHFHITHKRSETPFACKLCKARFANLRELNEHAMSHTYEKVRISCHHCGEVFSQRCSYKKHIQLHVGESLSCTICRIDFTQRSSLLRHYKRLHLVNDIPHPSGAAVVQTPALTIISK